MNLSGLLGVRDGKSVKFWVDPHVFTDEKILEVRFLKNHVFQRHFLSNSSRSNLGPSSGHEARWRISDDQKVEKIEIFESSQKFTKCCKTMSNVVKSGIWALFRFCVSGRRPAGRCGPKARSPRPNSYHRRWVY